MVAGVGEGASGLLPCHQAQLPEEYRDALLVTSWGDHRIEVYHPKHAGASLRAEREVLVQGDEWFRPVAIAAAPDGSIFFSDWVDVSYPVHRKGRLWRLSAKRDAKTKAPTPAPPIPVNTARSRMERLAGIRAAHESSELIEALSDSDPFIRSAAVGVLSRPLFRDLVWRETHSGSAAVRLGALLALRRAQVTNAVPVLENFLGDPDENIRLMATVWAGEAGFTQLTNRLKAALTAGTVSRSLVRAHAAASQLLVAKLHSATGATNARPPATSADGVRILTLNDQAPGNPVDANRIDSGASAREVAADKSQSEAQRCRAVAMLARDAVDHVDALLALLKDSSSSVRIEAARALRGVISEARVKTPLTHTAEQLHQSDRDPALLEEISLALDLSADLSLALKNLQRPASDEEWRQALSKGGSPAAGERVFFHPLIGCAKCHRVEDQGEQLGPDLSTIARGSDREKLMQSSCIHRATLRLSSCNTSSRRGTADV
jgi:HEAT repeat protein